MIIVDDAKSMYIDDVGEIKKLENVLSLHRDTILRAREKVSAR